MIIAISGASGVGLGVKFISLLPHNNQEYYIILSEGAKLSYKLEYKKSLKKSLKKLQQKLIIYDEKDIDAPISSGSFKVSKMAIIPCSSNTLAKCSCGIADNLISRAFHVMLKEGRKILLAPREMPMSAIMLENMTKLAKLGIVISPAVAGYYSNIQTVNDLENFIIGRWFDSLDIKHNLYKRWKGA